MAETHEGHDAQNELFRLLHVGHHVSTDEVKYAYEQQMAQATRSGDFERAMKLLAAYEQMTDARKRQVYGRVFDGRPCGVAPPSGGASVRARSRRALEKEERRRGRRERKWGMSYPIRVLVFGFIAPLVFLAAGVSASRNLLGLIRQEKANSATQEFVAGHTTQTAADSSAGQPTVWVRWRLPTSARPDARGLIPFVCAVPGVVPLEPVTSNGQAWPGSIVLCPPGSGAVVLSPRGLDAPPSMTATREP